MAQTTGDPGLAAKLSEAETRYNLYSLQKIHSRKQKQFLARENLTEDIEKRQLQLLLKRKWKVTNFLKK